MLRSTAFDHVNGLGANGGVSPAHGEKNAGGKDHQRYKGQKALSSASILSISSGAI